MHARTTQSGCDAMGFAPHGVLVAQARDATLLISLTLTRLFNL